MSSTTFILDNLLPKDAVKLGRLVLSIKYPEQDFCDPDPEGNGVTTGAPTTSSTIVETFTHLVSQSRDTSFHAVLTSLISGTAGRRANTQVEVSAPTCVTHTLTHSSQFFERACEAPRVRRWLERALRRRQLVFLVTGIKTVTDANVGVELTKGKEAGGEVRVPVDVAAAGGVPGVLAAGGVMDVGAGGSASRQATEKTGFDAPGEQIFAVQYRKVKFRLFQSRRVENGFLEEGARWQMYVGARGEAEDVASEEEEEDVVDATLSDTMSESDLDEGVSIMCTIGKEQYISSSRIVS